MSLWQTNQVLRFLAADKLGELHFCRKMTPGRMPSPSSPNRIADYFLAATAAKSNAETCEMAVAFFGRAVQSLLCKCDRGWRGPRSNLPCGWTLIVARAIAAHNRIRVSREAGARVGERAFLHGAVVPGLFPTYRRHIKNCRS